MVFGDFGDSENSRGGNEGNTCFLRSEICSFDPKWSKNAFLILYGLPIAWFSRLFSSADVYEEDLAQNGGGGGSNFFPHQNINDFSRKFTGVPPPWFLHVLILGVE